VVNERSFDLMNSITDEMGRVAARLFDICNFPPQALFFGQALALISSRPRFLARSTAKRTAKEVHDFIPQFRALHERPEQRRM
jgi:cobalamin biosynthesis protein CobD/CbiB